LPEGLIASPLSTHVGVEVSGVDLARPIDPTIEAALRDLLLRHHLLLFRGLDLSAADQARFARCFGETSLRELNKSATADKDSQFVSNTRADGIFGTGELEFHIDQLFLEQPLKALILYAVEVPETGGGTNFVDTHGVYDTLPAALRARIEGLRCRHERAYDKRTTADWNVVDAADARPSWVHPLVWTDPRTGRRAIWVNNLTTIGIEDMEPEAGARLIAEVRSHLLNETYIYRHDWAVGDLILWDNLVLQHARPPFDASAARTLRRTPIL